MYYTKHTNYNNFNKSLSTEASLTTNNQIDNGSISILINENDNTNNSNNNNNNTNNPFNRLLNWDDFKKEYYALEKRIKKSLENLQMIQIESTKQITLLETSNGLINKTNLSDNFKNQSLQVKEDLDKLSTLFKRIRLQEGDHDELIKQNMLKRFKEIHKDHEKEYGRLNSSIELNKKKLELFNETLKLGELNMENTKLSSKTNLLMDQNKGINNNISIANQIISQARHITHSFSDQKTKLIKVSGKLRRLKEEFSQVSNIMKKIKQYRFKKNLIISILMIIVIFFCFYKVFSLLKVI